jgi:anti-sigma B factor antagonist
MSMTVTARRIDGVVILDLEGRITIGDGSVVLRDYLQDLMKNDDRQFLLNLADVNYVDSSGLGQFVSSYTAVRNQDGQLKLLSLTHRIRDLMKITKLLTVFDVFEDETQALKSFR